MRIEKESIWRKDLQQTVGWRFNKYKENAKRKNIVFSLSKEEFIIFWQKSCYYCNDEIKTIGLDRVSNIKGYGIENVVPCCHICNGMKEEMTQFEFLSQCKKIINNNKL